MSEVHDFIVVGSGCTGAMAAQTLIESGAKVAMLDVGNEDTEYSSQIPDKDYNSIRIEEKNQYKYLIGENFEGIPWGDLTTGAQLTPSRKYMVEQVDKYLSIDSKTFNPMESLALGGLGGGWGLGCCIYSKQEMEKVGLEVDSMLKAYLKISERIGISGKKDDASPYTIGHLDNLHPAINIDANFQQINSKYLKSRSYFNKKGFYLGQPGLALITKDMNERKAFRYLDMDFYSDKDKSAYRPWITINVLKKNPKFLYIPKSLVIKFQEGTDEVIVICKNTETQEEITYKTKKLILAPGVLGTARIVLRSFPNEKKILPILCNPYCYIPCLQPSMIGKGIEKNKTGFAQLSLFQDESNKHVNVAMASIYTYRSLMLFRLIKEIPMDFLDSKLLMKYLLSGIVIMGIHHPEHSSKNKYLSLIKNEDSITKDKLHVFYSLSEMEERYISRRNTKFVAAMRKLGCYALKRISPDIGSSIHYAGTLPFKGEDIPYTLQFNGRLNGTKNVYVADGSGFSFLPAKGLTLSLMANAHNVANGIVK